MTKILGLAVVALSMTCGNVRGQDIDLHVVVKFEAHRELSPTLRQSLREQLGQALNSALQGIGRARVFDYDTERPDDRMPEWNRVFQLGFDKINRVVHGDRAKTHYVLIGCCDGVYRINSRQADGQLGCCSPIVRDATTADRENLARIVVQQLLADFGLIGTVVQFDGDRMVTIRFPGTNISDARLREWVHVGDPFFLVRVSSPGRCETVPHAYLIATGQAEGGQVNGKIENRFIKPLVGWERGQFRAVKLGATHGPIRLRLVGPNEVTPADVGVQLFATGLGNHDAERERGQARGGRFTSVERYDRMAYAKLTLGERLLAKVPLVVLGTDAITVEINTDPGGESAILAAADARAITTRLNDLLVRVNEENEQLRALIAARKNRQALAKVNELLRELEVEVPTIADSAVLLRSRTPAEGPLLDEIDRGLRDLKQHEQTLQKSKADLERANTSAATPEAERMRDNLKTLVDRSDQQMRDADYDKAIETLSEVLRQAGEWPEIQTRLEGLKRDWAIKSEAHRDARKHVYDVWAKAANVDDVDKHIDRVRQSLATCRDAGDKLTPRKVQMVLVKVAGWIERDNNELKRSPGEDSAAKGEKLRRLSAHVKSLLDEIETYLK